MKTLKNKKAQVQTIAPSIMMLVLAGLILIVGLIMTQELRDLDTLKFSTTISNETLTTVSNITVETVANTGAAGFSAFSVSTITNATDGVVIDSGNYTVGSAGTIIATDGGALSTFNNTDWNATYSYNSGGQAYISANDTVVGLGSFADFWEIIILAIVISVVIGLLLIVFGQPKRQR